MKRLLIATVTITLIAGIAYAMPGQGMHGMGGPGAHFGEGLLRLLVKLDLTDTQKHEAALILDKYRDEGKERRAALRKAFEGLRGTVEADPIDEDVIRAAFKGVAAAGEEMAVHGAKVIAELRGVLTAEQRAALEEHKAGRHERRKDRMENRTSFLDEWIDSHLKEPQ